MSLLDPDTPSHWDDPDWVRAFKAEMEAKLDAEANDDWVSMTPEQREASWHAMWFVAGMGPEHPGI